MKEHHFLHILADFHKKIIKKKVLLSFQKRYFFGTFEKSIFEALQKINHLLNVV